MTLIEFYVDDQIENICSSLACHPERVILVGNKSTIMERSAERYRKILENRGHEVEFLCRTAAINNLSAIIQVLSDIVEEYPNCIFDLTGGEDLYLVAAGIVLERYRDRGVQMHRYSVTKNAFIDCDGDEDVIAKSEPVDISVEENIRIYGGDIVYEEQRENTTFRWDMNEEFQSDIRAIWEICRKDVRAWNAQIGILKASEKLALLEESRHPKQPSEGLERVIPTSQLMKAVKEAGYSFVFDNRIVQQLREAGLVRKILCDDRLFEIEYKSAQVKYCLTMEGQALEMRVYMEALLAWDKKKNTKIYNDVMNGVWIDWDGEIHATTYSTYDTENEIDIVMIHGLMPIFVSCKNGYVDKNELYKLDTVAKRFGGKYAVKVLIATALESTEGANYIRQRAEDMGIILIEGLKKGDGFIDFADLSDEGIEKVVRKIWNT